MPNCGFICTFVQSDESLKETHNYMYQIQGLMLPSIISNYKGRTDNERRWTTLKDINLLPNGLVNDVDYYRELLNGRRGYVVAVDDDIDYYSVNEIFIQDYLTLDDGELLCDFILDHSIHI